MEPLLEDNDTRINHTFSSMVIINESMSHIYMDQTGKVPVISRKINKHVFVL